MVVTWISLGFSPEHSSKNKFEDMTKTSYPPITTTISSAITSTITITIVNGVDDLYHPVPVPPLPIGRIGLDPWYGRIGRIGPIGRLKKKSSPNVPSCSH